MDFNKNESIEEMKKRREVMRNEQKELDELIAKREREEEEKRNEELAREQAKRKDEVDASIKHSCELLKAYMNDYGSYQIAGDNLDFNMLFGLKHWNWLV